MEIVWKFLRYLKIELPYDLAITRLGTYPDRNTFEKIQAPLCSYRTIHNSQDKETTIEWIKKIWYIYTMECDSATKRMK